MVLMYSLPCMVQWLAGGCAGQQARGLQPEGGYVRQKWCICPEGFQTGLVALVDV